MVEGDTCEECNKHYGNERIRSYVYKHNICALHVDTEWSENVIEALKFLKESGITAEEYAQVRLSCNREEEKLTNEIRKD